MWWWLMGARREGRRELGRDEGGERVVVALKYFLSQKRDLLSDISGIVSHWRDLLSDIVSQKRDLLSDCQKCDIRTDGRSDHEG